MSIWEELHGGVGAFQQDDEMCRTGLYLAVVTNVNDEEKLNRVKCIPIENDEQEETDWCYVMAPLGGKGCGQFFFPSVNDLLEYRGHPALSDHGGQGTQLYHQNPQRQRAAVLRRAGQAEGDPHPALRHGAVH